jgi:hypothetical protein
LAHRTVAAELARIATGSAERYESRWVPAYSTVAGVAAVATVAQPWRTIAAVAASTTIGSVTAAAASAADAERQTDGGTTGATRTADITRIGTAGTTLPAEAHEPATGTAGATSRAGAARAAGPSVAQRSASAAGTAGNTCRRAVPAGAAIAQ